jgi:hypothetical protein
MLHRQLIFISLFFGVFTQQLRLNVDDWKDDKRDEIVYRQRRIGQPPQFVAQ